MKKELGRKLKLNRETLQRLADQDVKTVEGGLRQPTWWDSCKVCDVLLPQDNG